MRVTEKQANRNVGLAAFIHNMNDEVTKVVSVGVGQKQVTWYIHNDVSTFDQATLWNARNKKFDLYQGQADILPCGPGKIQ